ncbi:MAG: hypothetical protein KDB65_06490 [Calditrichaeota bacterium]|nr:hypothetical protein [Calditrichota bacterium]MCB9369759.1 hypothetical protein [Calditrichota bacterium]
MDDQSSSRVSWSEVSGGLTGYWLFDSENLGLEAAARVRGTGNFFDNKTRTRSDYYHQVSSDLDRRAQESYDANLSGAYYPTERPIGLIGTGLLSAGVYQYWYHDESKVGYPEWANQQITDGREANMRYDLSGELGLGWGRVRDASGIYRAHVLEIRLRELGRINGNLSDETLREVAELMYREREFQRRYERDDKYFWREVESVLKKDPALIGDLDAFAIERINEYIAPYSISRWSGVRFSMLLYGWHQNYIERNTTIYTRFDYLADTTYVEHSEISDHSVYHGEYMLFGPRLEVNIPLSWNVQFTGDSRFEKPIGPADDGFFWTTLLSGAYAVHDRWIIGYTLIHNRFIHDPKDRNMDNGQSWGVEHRFDVAYYIEQSLSITASIQQSQDLAWNYVPNLEQPHYKRHNSSYWASLQVTYLISGSRISSTSRSYLPRTSHQMQLYGYPRTY